MNIDNKLYDLISNYNKDYNLIMKQDILTMNNSIQNINFNTIEKLLNDLYVDFRTMEYSIEYLDYYIKNKIMIDTEKCKTLLKQIELNRDSLKESQSYNILIDFNNVYLYNHDRDNSLLSAININSQRIVPSHIENQTIHIEDASVQYNLIPYRNNIKDLISNITYKTYYLLDGVCTDGLEEIITLYLKDMSIVNYLNIDNCNCKVNKIHYIDENNTIIEDTNFTIGLKLKNKIKKIKIFINCNHYNDKAYMVNEKNIQNNFWDKLIENQFSLTTENKNIYDIDTMSGFNAFKTEYKEYFKKIKEWEVAYFNYIEKYKNWEKNKKYALNLDDIYLKGDKDNINIVTKKSIKSTYNPITVLYNKDGNKYSNNNVDMAFLKLATKNLDSNTIEYVDVSKMNAREINDIILKDENAFLVGGPGAWDKNIAFPKEHIYIGGENRVMTWMYQLRAIENRNLKSSINLIIIGSLSDINKYKSKFTIEAKKHITFITTGSKTDKEIEEYLKNNNNGVGIAILNKPHVDVQDGYALNDESFLRVIDFANSIFQNKGGK